MGDLVNGRGVILADFFAFKANLLTRCFNNFVQPIYITGYRKKIDISLTGTVVLSLKFERTVLIVWNFEIDEADQHVLSHIEGAEVVLAFGVILFSQNSLIFKLEEKNTDLRLFIQLSSNTNAFRTLPYPNIFCGLLTMTTQEHVSRRSTEKIWHRMKSDYEETCKILITISQLLPQNAFNNWYSVFHWYYGVQWIYRVKYLIVNLVFPTSVFRVGIFFWLRLFLIVALLYLFLSVVFRFLSKTYFIKWSKIYCILCWNYSETFLAKVYN